MLNRRLLRTKKAGTPTGFQPFSMAFYAQATGLVQASIASGALTFGIGKAPGMNRQWVGFPTRTTRNNVSIFARDTNPMSPLTPTAGNLSGTPYGAPNGTPYVAPKGPIVPQTYVRAGYDGTSATQVPVRQSKTITTAGSGTASSGSNFCNAWLHSLINNEYSPINLRVNSTPNQITSTFQAFDGDVVSLRAHPERS